MVSKSPPHAMQMWQTAFESHHFGPKYIKIYGLWFFEWVPCLMGSQGVLMNFSDFNDKRACQRLPHPKASAIDVIPHQYCHRGHIKWPRQRLLGWAKRIRNSDEWHDGDHMRQAFMSQTCFGLMKKTRTKTGRGWVSRCAQQLKIHDPWTFSDQ